MNGLHDLLATLKKIEEAGPAGPQAQYDPATQTLTYGGKQYKKASGFSIHNGIPLDPVVTAPPLATGSRTYGDTVNVVLKPDGTYYETKYSPEQIGQAAPAVAPADGKDRVPAPETPQQVYDRNDKAKLAQQMLKTQVKSRDDLGMVNGYYIEKETGTLLHHMIANDRGGQAQGTVVKFADLSYGQGKEFLDQLTSIGLVPQPKEIFNPGIFNWKWTQSKYAILQINLQDLARIAQNQPPTMEKPPTPQPPVEKPPVEKPPVDKPSANDQQALPGDNAGLKRFRDLINKAQGIEGADKLESIKFKSLIGRTLLAELSKIEYLPANQSKPQPVATVDVTRPVTANDQQVATGFNGGQTGRMFGNLTAAEVAEGDKLYQSYGDSSDPEIMNLLKQWSEIKNNMLKAGPGPVDPKPPVVDPKPPVVDPKPPVVDPKPPTPVDGKCPPGWVPSKDGKSCEKATVIRPVKPENDQKKKYPEEWTTVKIVRANSHAGTGPQNQVLYILGDGTKKRTFAYYRQENKTLVPMNINPPREDLKEYEPIPWDVASKWGTAAQPTTDDKKRPGLDPNKGDPKVWDRQKQLQDAGAKNKKGKPVGGPLTTDGIMGDDTRAAEKEFGPKIAAKPEDEQQTTATDVPPMPWLTQAPPPKGIGLDPLFGTGNRDYIKWLERNVKAKPDSYYWVNGDRYKLTGKPNQLQWQKDSVIVGMGSELNAQLRNYTGPEEHKQEFADAQQKIWTDAMYDRMRREKPGVMKESGYTNDELSRIISLVHHR